MSKWSAFVFWGWIVSLTRSLGRSASKTGASVIYSFRAGSIYWTSAYIAPEQSVLNQKWRIPCLT